MTEPLEADDCAKLAVKIRPRTHARFAPDLTPFVRLFVGVIAWLTPQIALGWWKWNDIALPEFFIIPVLSTIFGGALLSRRGDAFSLFFSSAVLTILNVLFLYLLVTAKSRNLPNTPYIFAGLLFLMSTFQAFALNVILAEMRW
jgi:hypothetical protein